MALTATLYHFQIELADVDRAVYQSLELKLAQHPSETADYMLTRLLAYCLEYAEGIAFTGGVSSGDLPALQISDLSGQLMAWIEVGAPPAERLHRGSKLAARTALYTHKNLDKLLAGYDNKKIHQREQIKLVAFAPEFIARACAAIQRRNQLTLSVTEGQIYLQINEQSFDCQLQEQRLA